MKIYPPLKGTVQFFRFYSIERVMDEVIKNMEPQKGLNLNDVVIHYFIDLQRGEICFTFQYFEQEKNDNEQTAS